MPAAIVVIDRGHCADLCDGITALDVLRERLTLSADAERPDLNPELSYFRDRDILERMSDVHDLERELLARDGIDRRTYAPFTKILGGFCPRPLDGTAEIPDRPTDLSEVHDVYEKSPATRERWIKHASKQLASGNAGPAWVIGHELHACGKRFNAPAIELLKGAYALLNRPQFTEIARIHHAHRQLSDE